MSESSFDCVYNSFDKFLWIRLPSTCYQQGSINVINHFSRLKFTRKNSPKPKDGISLPSFNLKIGMWGAMDVLLGKKSAIERTFIMDLAARPTRTPGPSDRDFIISWKQPILILLTTTTSAASTFSSKFLCENAWILTTNMRIIHSCLRLNPTVKPPISHWLSSLCISSNHSYVFTRFWQLPTKVACASTWADHVLSGAISIGALLSNQTACWKTGILKPARIT